MFSCEKLSKAFCRPEPERPSGCKHPRSTGSVAEDRGDRAGNRSKKQREKSPGGIDGEEVIGHILKNRSLGQG